MRVPDGKTGHAIRIPVELQRFIDDFTDSALDGDQIASERDGSHIHSNEVCLIIQHLNCDTAAQGLKLEPAFQYISGIYEVLRKYPYPVSALFRLTAVRIEYPQADPAIR